MFRKALAKIDKGLQCLGLAGVFFYRAAISPWLKPRCRFQPTCSEYAQDALRTQGGMKAMALIFWRLLRCQPFGKGGYDPVQTGGIKQTKRA